MVLPAIPVILAILALLGSGAVGFGIGILIEKIGGKKVVVLGSRLAGKTTLATFLETGSIPEKHEQTTHVESKKGRRIELKELKLKINRIEDVPGSKEHYRQWKEAFVKSDIVLYLFSADEIWEGNTDTEKRVNNDLEHIDKWIKENNNNKLYCIGTHCDLIPGFSRVNPENQGEFEDKLRALPAMKKLRLRAGNSTPFIFGSMKTARHTEVLTCCLLRELVK